jgi:hypothetical protein
VAFAAATLLQGALAETDRAPLADVFFGYRSSCLVYVLLARRGSSEPAARRSGNLESGTCQIVNLSQRTGQREFSAALVSSEKEVQHV